MDSLTQASLGAAIGGAVGGKRGGRKAALWGAFAGTLPDLDVLAYPFLSPGGQLAFHRGPTHALWFGFIAAIPLAYGAARWHRETAPAITWRRWYTLFVLALVTHPLLDALTVYGTQLLWPFTEPFDWAALFIIDPLYTLPLLIGAGWVLLRPGSRQAQRANRLGLILSSAYLVWACSAKLVVTERFENAMLRDGLAPTKTLTAPMPLQTVLWMSLADTGDSLYVALHSLRDTAPIRYAALPTHRTLLAPHTGADAVERLDWFSQGYALMEQRGDSLLLHDPRFGRLDGWRGAFDNPLIEPPHAPSYVFSFHFEQNENGEIVGFDQLPQGGRLNEGDLAWLIARVKGM